MEKYNQNSENNLKSRELDVDKKIEIFINMLNQGNSEILKADNTKSFDGYPDMKISGFWGRYKSEITEKLFVELKDDSGYDISRQTVLNYYKVSTYEELVLKYSKVKKLNDLKKVKQDLETAIEYIEEVDLDELEQKKRTA